MQVKQPWMTCINKKARTCMYKKTRVEKNQVLRTTPHHLYVTLIYKRKGISGQSLLRFSVLHCTLFCRRVVREMFCQWYKKWQETGIDWQLDVVCEYKGLVLSNITNYTHVSRWYYRGCAYERVGYICFVTLQYPWRNCVICLLIIATG